MHMRKHTIIIILIVTGFISFGQTKHVLFIGNSITASGIPDLFTQLALSKGDTVIAEQFWNGQLLREYVQDEVSQQNFKNKLNERPWDYVVLQENSQVGGFYPGYVDGYFEFYSFEAAKKLNQLIKENNKCTETVFFMTYGYVDGDLTNFPNDTYIKMQERLERNYKVLADSNSATLAPIGSTWKKVRNDKSWGTDLYMPGDHHPSFMGSYLAACVFYATIFQKSPVGSNFNAGVDSAKAAFIQFAADSVVFSDQEKWNININKPKAGFDYNITGDTLHFYSTTRSNYADFNWFIDNTNVSQKESFRYKISGKGNYNVVQKVTNICYDPDSISTIIYVCPPPIAQMTFDIHDDKSVTFQNQSLRAAYYEWIFSDGTSDTNTNPIHQFDSVKAYIVCLLAKNDCGIDTFCRVVETKTNGLENTISKQIITIYPNPTTGQVNIQAEKGFSLFIYDSQGKLVESFVTPSNHKHIDHLETGFYFMELKFKESVEVRKVLVK